MKPPKHSLLNPILSFCTIVAAAVMFAGSARAQLIAYDDAGNYRLNANWTNGANQGFGFTPWTFVTNGPDFNGTFINSANNPAFAIASITNVLGVNSTNVWGLFANGTDGINEMTAYRGFASSLGTNTFKLQWGSTGAGNQNVTGSGTVHGWIGFSLRTGNATNAAYDLQSFPDPTAQFYLYFLDGNAVNTLIYYDGSGIHSVPNTSFSNLGRNNITNAVETEITPGSDGVSYHLVLKDCVQNAVLFVTNGTLINAGQTVDSAALFCYEASGDQIYNRMQIAVATNIPPTISNPQPADGSLYVSPGATNLSFEVDSFNSTVAGSAVSVFLNGVLQSGAVFNSAGGTNQLLGTNGVTLAQDTFYTYTIIAQDANGNVASNNFTFNTFLPGDLYIDAYDYNYGSGQFVNNSTPTNAYANLLGNNGVDYSISDLTGANNTAGYRPGDLVQTLALPTDATGDPVDHANLRANGWTAYNVGFTVAGNWENYTRVIPVATNYSIYARAASGTGGQFEIERLTNATATSASQPLIALGRVNVPVSGGSLIYNGELTPLTDIFGNTVVVPLSGTNTLRETAISSQGYNLEYLLVVAVTNATGKLRPYFATASPAPNATGVGLVTPLTFTLVNRQTTVNISTLKLFTNSVQVASGVSSNANPAGIVVSFTPAANRSANTIYTNTVVYTDSDGVNITNSWTFVTGTTGGLNANGVWSGLGGTNNMNWATATNWTGGTPGPTFFASFTSSNATTTLVTNNIVSTNVTIAGLFYATNNSGYHTTWIQDGVTLTISNGTTATVNVFQAGGQPANLGDNSFNSPVTNTITGANATFAVMGNPQSSGAVNAINFQVRQAAIGAASLPNLVTVNMAGLGTFTATIGKFYVAQGGAGGNQANVSGCVYLARTNMIALLRTGNAGQFEVGDSSGGTIECPGSSLYLGITNAFYVDTIRFGKNKATNNLVAFNPAFTNSTTPVAYIRGTNSIPSPSSRATHWSIGDADNEITVPNYVQANVDFSGGKLDALVNYMVLGRGEVSATDSGFAQGTLTFTAGTLDVLTVTNGMQRGVNTATESGVINILGTATLASTNIILAVTNAGANAALVSGTLNVTNGTVRGNINAGGGVSTVNLKSGTLVVSNNVGSAAVPLSALNLSTASLHFRADGNATTASITASSVGVTGTSTITVDAVANVSGPKTIHLISYSGATPFAGLSLAPLPAGYTGSLVDSGTSIDLNINAVASKPPTIRNISIGSGLVIIGGTNNAGAGGTYSVLTSTNLLVALTNWVVLTNSSFDANGNFSSTNATGTNSQQFYILRVP
ncbi:MAG TPA: hypothetical protein VK815_05930 [Candidatus Acidoferrales bacterium]|jgi:hypothetical protein|nr:hypothetical protein [Candidatus Acidoferrales bacterium]